MRVMATGTNGALCQDPSGTGSHSVFKSAIGQYASDVFMEQ